MHLNTKFAALASALVLACLQAPCAQADTVLVNQTEMVVGTQSFVYSFLAPSAGTITVQLTNLAWPEMLSGLSFVATTSTKVLDTFSSTSANSAFADTASADPLSFSVSGAGAYFAHLTGTAQGPLQLGLYSIDITFSPSPVPLPASAWLLILGIATIAGIRGPLRAMRVPLLAR